MIEDHIQFDIQIYSRAGNIDYSPSLKSQIIKDNLSILQKNSVLMPFTDNQEVNMFLKEILIPISDDLVKSITKIRVHNVSNITNKYYIGISLYNSTNNVVGECRFGYDTEEEAINNRKNILDNGYGRYILVDWNNIPYGKYTDYECNMFRINNIDFSPSIYNYINSSILNKVQSFGFTNNKIVNSFLKEIYIPISDAILVTVDRIRIHNISNLSDKYYIGFVLYSASANVADCLFEYNTADEAVKNRNNFINKNGCYALIDWGNVEENKYIDYQCSFSKINDIEFSPTIKSHISDFSSILLPKDISFSADYQKNTNIDDSGNVITQEQVNLTGYIKVNPTKKYNFNLKRRIAQYDNKSKLIRVDNYASQVVPFDVKFDKGCYSVRFNFTDNETPQLLEISDNGDEKVDANKVILSSGKSLNEYINNVSLDKTLNPKKGQIVYKGDTKVSEGHIVNAVMYKDGVIIAARSNGKVVRIGYGGTEEVLLTINGTKMDWRGLFIDSNENVFVSPHASLGDMPVSDRGIYKLTKGESAFVKVHSLYNTSSDISTEREDNDDTIWTFCEDRKGNLYAGVYAHLKRPNPSIYKSTDGGNTWTLAYSFNTGLHIHSLIYNEWKDALYCIVGEIDTLFKSINGGTEWTNLNAHIGMKGSAMLAINQGILVGSDGAYNCDIDLLLNDDKTFVKVFRGWASTVFAIRKSDLTGMIYAFCKIDSSVNALNYYPPIDAISEESALQSWKGSQSAEVVEKWQNYYDSVIDTYPEDAIRPQHCAILVSRDNGITWNILYKIKCGSAGAWGFWTTGYFFNGECLTGYLDNTKTFSNPLVISEGKKKYTTDGIELEGEVLIRTNESTTVRP